MPGFKTINSISEITLSDKWVPATKFNSKNRLVDEKGHRVGSDYKGRQCRIIEKRERNFSGLERFGRGLLGTVAVICTLCLGLFSKSIRNLFTKSKENIRFAVLEPSIPSNEQRSNSSLDQNISDQSSKEKINEPTEQTKNIAATNQSLFRGHLARSAFKNLKNEREEALRIQEERRKSALENEARKQDEENLKKTDEPKAKENPLNPIPSDVGVKIEPKPVDKLTNPEFLNWLKEDTDRLGEEQNTKKLISLIKNEEVTEEEIRDFYAGLSESIVLQMLNFTQTANSFNAVNEKIIEKALILETNFIQALNKKCPHKNLELRAKIEQRTLGPSIFRHSMSNEEIQKIGVEFFEDLRKSGRLLTKQEFVDQNHPKGAHWDKGSDLGRIQGANYIKRIAEELGLKHIKVPKKIAVLNEGITSVPAVVSPYNLELSSDQVTIFAENITPLGRGTTREEVTEFLKILEATGFGDFFGDNFMLGRNSQGEEGIYFIDTEYMNFRHIPFLENNVAPGVTRMVQKKDWDWINQPDGFGSYCGANKQRVNRYFKTYGIKEGNLLGNLLKTYVPEDERRKESVEFTYNVS